jgi:hypothetical protein
MELHFTEKTEEISKIEHRIKEMVLAYKIITHTEITDPSLIDGKKTYSGIEEMNAYLDQLDKERKQWYYCNF